MTNQTDRHHRLIAGTVEGGRVVRHRIAPAYLAGYGHGIVEGEERERRRHEPKGGPLRVMAVGVVAAFAVAAGCFGWGYAAGRYDGTRAAAEKAATTTATEAK